MPKIRMHEKALAHLTRGLYRSPASALRELVSNAWDANATNVTIATNYPNFYQISVEDNGDGFSLEEFEKLMKGGIGNSEKRSEDKMLRHGRPTIGRLGIGMLGIAQICLGFKISSKTADGKGFKAEIRLTDLIKPKLDKDDPEVVSKSDSVIEDDTPMIVDVGEYKIIDDYDAREAKKGTVIIADDVHPNFTKAFQESLTFEKFKTPPLDWSKALKIVSSVHSLQELGDYWRLLWELAASSPIPYVNARAVPRSLILTDHERLEKHNFRVTVDGIELAKPVNLRGNPDGYTLQKIDVPVEKVYGKNLAYHGYIAVQEGKQIRPDELRGIMIRIKNVGVGYYDGTLLDYRFNEGPRSRWITGEIHVDEGLEDALNVDRDSFNRFHPEFKHVQDRIHKILREEVFPKVYKQIEQRSEERSQNQKQGRDKLIKSVLSEAAGKPVKFTRSVGSEDQSPIKVSKKRDAIELEVKKEDELNVKKPNRQLLLAILSIYEIALLQKSREQQREVFTKLALDLLSKW